MLQHHYGVAADQITWVEDKDQPHFAGLGNPRPRGSEWKSKWVSATFCAAVPLSLSSRLVWTLSLPQQLAHPHGIHASIISGSVPEIRMYLEATGVFPINTVITLKLDAVRKHPHLPAQLMGAFREAKLLYQAEVLAGSETDHMGLDLGVLREMGPLPRRVRN